MNVRDTTGIATFMEGKKEVKDMDNIELAIDKMEREHAVRRAKIDKMLSGLG